MDGDALRPLGQANPGSATWRPDTIAQHRADVSRFLDSQFSFPMVRQAAERTLALLDLVPGQSVLDVGCGNGAFLSLLGQVIRPHGHAVGLDYAPAFVDEAKARINAEGLDDCVTVVEGDAYKLPFDDNSFGAARCERVFMHLDDPTAALREMRPGGLVVATEPDWASMVIDHPDPEAFTLLYDGFLTRFRQPRMGRSLYRLFGDARLVDRDVTLIPSFHTSAGFLQQVGLDLAPQVDRVVADGTLSRERAEAAAAYFASADKEGVFFSSGAYFIASGRVPND